MLLPAADHDALRALLHNYNEQPQQRERIVAEIEQRFQHPVAVLVVDSCGFSRAVRSVGIVHFLALLERLERLITPAIAAAGGRVLRREADNIFAVFPDAAAAVAAAATIVHDVDVANRPLPAADEIYVSVGVGYGELLIVGAHDIFGDEMNLACKLGEDLAQQSEILLTPGAFAALGDTSLEFEQANFSISGIDLAAYRLVQDSPPTEARPNGANHRAVPEQA